jgi:hypothetical protein
MCRQNDRTEESAIQLQVKTILNVVQHFVGFVYNEVRLPCRQGKPQSIEIRVEHARWDPSALFALPTSRTGRFQTSSEGRVSICGMGRGKRADNSLTVICQIDAHCWRLLWAGKRRSQATLRRGLKMLGLEVVQGLRV